MPLTTSFLRRAAAASAFFFVFPAPSSLFSQALKDPANLAGERPFPQSPADTLPLNHGAPALQQLLLKLRTRASMMLIIAHPDDEDGGLLTYASRGLGARVAMLTLTRGEGGQNLMSADFDDALGLIRTQELLAADRFFGADQFFGTEVDFGFSKTLDEAMSQWTHDRVLYDAVRAVRLYRPLVLASVFVGGPTDGHGQHQVSGQICQEVYLAAADPKVFPEMGLAPWAPLKVYARVPFSRVTDEGMFDYATGKTVPTRFHNYVTGVDIRHEPALSVLIHEGDPATVFGKPALGMEGDSYLQFARKGLALQKSQIGAGVRVASPGAFDVGYTLMASRVPTPAIAAASLGPSGSAQGSSPANQPPQKKGASATAPTGEIPTQTGPAPTSRSNSGPVSLPPGTTAPEQSLFDGIDVSISGLASLAPNASFTAKSVIKSRLASFDRNLAEAQRAFDPNHLEACANPLRETLTELDSSISALESLSAAFIPKDQAANLLHELRTKRVQLNDALLLALAINATATLAESKPITPGVTYAVNFAVTDPSPAAVNLAAIDLAIGDGSMIKSPGRESGLKGTLHATLPPTAKPTEPPFHQDDPTKPFYTVTDPDLRLAPQAPAPIVAHFSFDYRGTRLQLPVTVTAQPAANTAATIPLQPAVIVPPYSAAITPSVAIASTEPSDRRPIPFAVEVRTNVSGRSPQVTIQAPNSWKLEGPAKDFTLPNAGDSLLQSITADPGTLPTKAAQDSTIKAYIRAPQTSDGAASDLGYRSVGYPGITRTNLYKPAVLRVAPVDVTTAPGLRIAYLPGTGDSVPDYLPNLGITPTLITPADLNPTSLARFDAVLVGVRAYAAQSALAGKGSQPLLDYARQGGVVILEYMTARFGDPEAPYPISIPGDSAHNVVEEADRVTILAPQSPILTWPNTIIPNDFHGWTEEWGHGFAATFAPQYTPLLEVHDPGQDPQHGGLLLAPVGKGAYIYCALALYRQLPQGVPGAYRLLANLLSYAKNPHRN